MSSKQKKRNYIYLTDGNGKETGFELLDTISFYQNEYVILYPIINPNNEIVILQREDVGNKKFEYIGVENEIIMEAVFALFKERNKDMFN